VTDQLGESLLDFGLRVPVCVVPNVVDTNLFQIAPRTAPPVLLHISSLVDEQKNVTGLIAAFGQALDRLPEGTTLHVIGDGDPAPHAATAQRLGIGERVITGGEISLAEVAKRMAAASAVLLFSRFENFPCVIPEAWAAGTPVVATDVGGISEHVPVWGALDAGPERGACVASEDTDAFVEALLHALDSAIDREAMRRFAEERFSVAAIGTAFEAVYTEILDRG
jgi:glycosyltransferase involved in cell wall biosynthesis